MVSCLSSMVKSIRTSYNNKFISIHQDIWDSKRCELHGISLMSINPETFQHFNVSGGLVHISGKKAAETCGRCHLPSISRRSWRHLSTLLVPNLKRPGNHLKSQTIQNLDTSQLCNDEQITRHSLNN